MHANPLGKAPRPRVAPKGSNLQNIVHLTPIKPGEYHATIPTYGEQNRTYRTLHSPAVVAAKSSNNHSRDKR